MQLQGRVGTHLKGRSRHPGIYKRASKTVFHSLRTRLDLQVGERLDQVLPLLYHWDRTVDYCTFTYYWDVITFFDLSSSDPSCCYWYVPYILYLIKHICIQKLILDVIFLASWYCVELSTSSDLWVVSDSKYWRISNHTLTIQNTIPYLKIWLIEN